ncbi:MAG: ATP-binding protein [Lachnospiraceae bacterium]|nr:ATP-binding protein [Lachnospiraceae bacterium]
MIVGRKKELKILGGSLRDDRSHFIALYGRRRIGKTFLVREAFGYRFTFQHAGLSKGGLKEQLFAFSSSVRDAGGEVKKNAKNWLEAFEYLKDLIRSSSEKKKVVFIDELSWMDTPRCDLMPALENFWNGWASGRKDVVLIVCASATSWMLSNVIHNKGGLYNRVTEEIHLEMFSLRECEEYVKSFGFTFTRDQILQYYMVFGGVPYYWTFLEKGESIPQIIDRIIFAGNAPLHDEFTYLYASIFRHPDAYVRIIKTLSKRKAGMSREEIIENSKIVNSGDLTKKLEELESCGFIRKYRAYGMKKKNAVYQLIDFFTLFYYTFMENEPTDPRFWTDHINTPIINTWKGLAFERVALSHIDRIKQKLGISGVQTDVNAWYCRQDKEKGITGAQIDLLIVRKDQVINLCEMKYSDTDFRVTEEAEKGLREKINSFVTVSGTGYAIFPTLVTTHGLAEGGYADIFQSVVVLDDLF